MSKLLERTDMIGKKQGILGGDKPTKPPITGAFLF
jgi:hypothetical protein